MDSNSAWENKLYFGDNLGVLREYVGEETVDLIYLDPPFNSNATYNVLFQEQSGEKSVAQITAFEDTWHWGIESEYAYHEVVKEGPKRLADLLQAMRSFLGQNDMMAYLTMMAQRMVELHRVLKPTGSIYLHCDPTASHYLKLLMDAVFGPRNFLSEIVWKRTYAHGSSQKYGPVHDTLLFYSKSNHYLWTSLKSEHDPDYIDQHFTYTDQVTGRKFQPITLTGSGIRYGDSGKPWKGIDPTKTKRHWALPSAIIEKLGIEDVTVQGKLDALDAASMIYWPSKSGGTPRLKWYTDQLEGVALPDIWSDIPPISARAAERLGYPTQKPESLLERIIMASSNEHDLILDPFCGCGTSIAVAEGLRRRWIGIDITHLAVTLMRHRLQDAFRTDLSPYEVIGVPKDLTSAAALAQEDRHEFEIWALGLVDARPAQDTKGADAGIDGYINFFDDNSGKAKTVIVQVKSGHVTVSQVRDLNGVLGREKATIGVFITLEDPTRPMLEEAATAGFYEPEHFPNLRFPRLQIVTVKELLLDSKEIQYPRLAPTSTFKRAQRKKVGTQQSKQLL